MQDVHKKSVVTPSTCLTKMENPTPPMSPFQEKVHAPPQYPIYENILTTSHSPEQEDIKTPTHPPPRKTFYLSPIHSLVP